MKIIAIGDIHGRNTWKKIMRENLDADKIIFVGDYFDTRDEISQRRQINNFKEILIQKDAAPEQIELLYGNHDHHYAPWTKERYSGYEAALAMEIGELIRENFNNHILRACCSFDGYMFSHAGITGTWCLNNDIDPESKTLPDDINELLYHKPRAFDFAKGSHMDPSGDNPEQSPIWVRPESLLNNHIKGYVHVVGHTQVARIHPNVHHGIILIDALGTGEYLEVNDGTPEVKKLSTPPQFK